MRDWKSSRLGDARQSYIRRMTRECDAVGGINLGQGVCDLPTPPEILEATARAVADDRSTYSKYEGVDELREQIARKAEVYNALPNVDPDGEIVVTVGATGAFHCTLAALLNPGDEVLVFEPYYGYHVNTILGNGLVPVFVPAVNGQAAISREALNAAASPRTRAIVVNTPANPSGKVYDRTDLECLAEFAGERDLLVITDEIYEYIVFDRPHISPASLPALRPRTVTISGFSKTFSITGWRLGYAMAPPALSARIGIANDLMYICAPTPLQYGVAAGMSALGPDYYAGLARDYRAKRDLLCGTLADIGLPPLVPMGAYYVLADISGLGDDDEQAAMTLLRERGVAGVPGRAFFSGNGGRNLVRFCFAKEPATLQEACRRLRGQP